MAFLLSSTRDTRSGAARPGAGLRQRLGLGMRPSARCGRPTANDSPVLDDNAADSRVGPNLPKPPRTERKGMGHMPAVCLCAHSSEAPGGRSSDTNLSKSSAAWKFSAEPPSG